MQVSVAFRHMDVSEAVQRYASEKLQHIAKKYVQGMDIDSQVVFSLERYQHVANFTINVNGLTLKCVEKTDNMYSSIDLALDKVERQMNRFKSRIRDHRPDSRRRSVPMQILAPAPAAAEQVEETPAVVNHSEAKHIGGHAITTLQREELVAPYLSPDEALMQIELRHAQFLVFTNKETESICILYRRDDGNFGLIEPEAAKH